MNSKRAPADWSMRLVYFFLALAGILVLVQTWSVIETDRLVEEARTASEALPHGSIADEKLRQELIGARVKNEAEGAMSVGLATAVGTLTTALVAISGALLAFRSFLDARRKLEQERIDQQQKERIDRLGGRLNETLTRLVAEEARQRIVGAAGLLPFFAPDTRDFHLQALAALVAAARFPDETVDVRHAIRLAVEQAARNAAPELLRQVSWQRVNLAQVNLSGSAAGKPDLSRLDLRDANLQNARLEGTHLDGADLSAAQLQGASLARAHFVDATLDYADLAGADLKDAILSGASLEGLKVLNADLAGAVLRPIGNGWRGVPWDAARNWRQAHFDEAVRRELDRIYGSDVPAYRVVMLMWELPPLVAGGTWTACYHLVRNLRRRGADVTVVVPWRRETLLPMPFSVEVPIVALGIDLPGVGQGGRSAPGGPQGGPYYQGAYPAWSANPYAGWTSPYAYVSPYGGSVPFWSSYVRRDGATPAWIYGAYPSAYSAYRQGSGGASWPGSEVGLSGSILYRLIGEFRRRFAQWIRSHPAELIHAHDWVTFDAAREAAAAAHIPWLAHFHSTEIERNAEAADPLTERIERGAVDSATRIIAPSRRTMDRLRERYQAKSERIDVVPNSLSEGAAPTAEMGRFETRRVLFLGRLSRQKGVDRYVELADELRRSSTDCSFEATGDGEEARLLAGHGVKWNGAVGWDERGRAYAGASVVVVPSRDEPFGMVILEAMQHRVPVIYPAQAGAAEVLESGVKVNPQDVGAMATELKRLLGRLDAWEEVVLRQAKEIEAYPLRDFPDRLIGAWKQCMAPAPA